MSESIKTVKKAFSALRDRYGDEERVLGLRVAELQKLGSVYGTKTNKEGPLQFYGKNSHMFQTSPLEIPLLTKKLASSMFLLFEIAPPPSSAHCPVLKPLAYVQFSLFEG